MALRFVLFTVLVAFCYCAPPTPQHSRWRAVAKLPQHLNITSVGQYRRLRRHFHRASSSLIEFFCPGLSAEAQYPTRNSHGWLSFTRPRPLTPDATDVTTTACLSFHRLTRRSCAQINGRSLVCAMELIAPRWLMTACHCVLNTANTAYEPAGSRGMSQAPPMCRNTRPAAHEN